jgi:SAM-dependent methyltransferase
VNAEDETRAVVARYARRAVGDRYSPLRPEVWQTLHERQAALLRLWAQRGITDLSALRLVEVGCGTGGNLLELLRLGFAPAHLTGLELLPERMAQARRVLPAGVGLQEGDATQADVAPGSQDIVFVSTVFSSLLDDAFQHRLAAEMWRWLRPGGAVLWYDFTFNNPSNADVRGMPLSRVAQLFPAARITSRRVTLAPPLARLVCRLHPGLYSVCNAVPWLRTHRLAWLEKPAAG